MKVSEKIGAYATLLLSLQWTVLVENWQPSHIPYISTHIYTHTHRGCSHIKYTPVHVCVYVCVLEVLSGTPVQAGTLGYAAGSALSPHKHTNTLTYKHKYPQLQKVSFMWGLELSNCIRTAPKILPTLTYRTQIRERGNESFDNTSDNDTQIQLSLTHCFFLFLCRLRLSRWGDLEGLFTAQTGANRYIK